jgi:hypothetical protein
VHTLAEGLPELQQATTIPCFACQKGKQVLKVNRKPQRRAEQLLELVHSDLGDLSKEKEASLGGSRYFILFVNDFSRFTWTYFLKTKSKQEVMQAFKVFKALVENQTGLTIKRFWFDNGRGEYSNDDFKQFLKNEGISSEPAPPYQH